MRALVCVVLFALLACARAQNANEEKYSDRYDYINVEEILANDRLRDQYFDCFMDTAPCVTADALFFKGNFPEAMATKCSKCTEQQKENFNKMADWYTRNQPEKWDAFVAKFLNEAKAMNA